MFRKLTDLFYSMRFGQRLCIILILFALIPMLLIQQILMHFYEKHIVDSASNSAYSIVNANNNSLDMLLDNIETAAQQMIDSQFYYDTFSELNDFSVGDCLRYDRILTQELAKQFIYQEAVYDVYLYTSKWLFGVNTGLMPITIDSFRKAGFEELARNASGLSCWVTGYDYGEQTQNDYLVKKSSYDFRYPLTMLKEMQFQYTSQGYYQRLSEDTEKPILVVQVLEKSLRNLYKDSVPYDGSLYVIANSEGSVVSSDNDTFPVGTVLPEDLSPYLRTSGYVTYDLKGEKNLLCYDTLDGRGFFSFRPYSHEKSNPECSLENASAPLDLCPGANLSRCSGGLCPFPDHHPPYRSPYKGCHPRLQERFFGQHTSSPGTGFQGTDGKL